MSGMEKQQIDLLKSFISLCKTKPSVLHMPELSFFKTWLESMDATVPPPEETPKSKPEPTEAPKPEPAPEPTPEPEVESEEEIESDLELDLSCVVEPDNDPPQPMPESSGEVSEEMMDACNDLCSEAQQQVGDGNLDVAIEKFTEALQKNPGSTRAWAKRASVYIKLKKPNAAHRDCDKALGINPDNAQGLKWRGRANMMLGNWLEALSDFSNAQKVDYDEQCAEWLKIVMPNANKIREHNHKYEMKRDERERNKRRERLQKAKEAREKAMKEEAERAKRQGRSGGFPGGMPGFPGGMPGGFPGGMPGGFPGGMPGGFPGGAAGFGGGGSGGGGAGGMPPDLAALLNDPELLQAFQDPEVSAAFQDISANPANMTKYQDNPKIQKLLEKLGRKFGGPEAGAGPTGGAPGGFGGFPPGMPGFPGGPPPPSDNSGSGSNKPSSSTFDVD